MRESKLQIEDLGPIRVLTMNRPGKLNALDAELTERLCDALEGAGRDDTIRAVVLTGAGRAFCAGADISEFRELTREHAERVHLRADLTMRVQSLPRQIAKPVVAAARGVAVGGGAGLALACDMLVAAEDIRFGYPEFKHGLVPALVMTSLVRHVGPKLAFELVSTGRLLGGRELGNLNLANRVVPADAVVKTALDIASAWTRAPEQAMREAKSLLHLISDLAFDQAMEAGREANIRMRGFSRGNEPYR